MPDIGNEWPKRVEISCAAEKMENWVLGEKIGLSGDALLQFRHACTDVYITVDVYKDGTYRIISAKG